MDAYGTRPKSNPRWVRQTTRCRGCNLRQKKRSCPHDLLNNPFATVRNKLMKSSQIHLKDDNDSMESAPVDRGADSSPSRVKSAAGFRFIDHDANGEYVC